MRTINRHTHLHIGVTRSLRVSVPRDAQVRARVPSGSQVHLRTCMPMPARAGARAEAGAPVRVLAYKGARLSLPLSADTVAELRKVEVVASVEVL